MADIINLKKVRQARAERKTLCTSGFHKWETLTERRFDVKQGKLISAQRCKRCGEERVKLL